MLKNVDLNGVIKEKEKKVYRQSCQFICSFPCVVGKTTITPKLIKDYLDLIGCSYRFIKHDKDIKDNEEEERLKNNHYHLVLLLDRKTTRNNLNKKIFKNLCIFEDLSLINMFEVKECFNIYGAIQYLIHKNDLNKYQYSMEEIITNNYKDLLYYLSNLDTKLNYNDLYNCILNSNGCYPYIIKNIGLQNFNRNFRCIDSIYKSLYGNKVKVFSSEEVEEICNNEN